MSERHRRRPLYEDIVGKNDIGAPGSDEVYRARLNQELGKLKMLNVKPGSLEHLKLLSGNQEDYEMALIPCDDETNRDFIDDPNEKVMLTFDPEYAQMVYLQQSGLAGCYSLLSILGRFFSKSDLD